MKKLWSLILAAALILGLAACAGKAEPFDLALAQTLVEADGVFSEELEPLDRAIIDQLYGLEEGQVTEAVSYHSTGATAEEVTVLRFEDEEAAQAYLERANAYLEEQREANVDYRPQEMPKLDEARVDQRGETVLILVAADYAAAAAFLK